MNDTLMWIVATPMERLVLRVRRYGPPMIGGALFGILIGWNIWRWAHQGYPMGPTVDYPMTLRRSEIKDFCGIYRGRDLNRCLIGLLGREASR